MTTTIADFITAELKTDEPQRQRLPMSALDQVTGLIQQSKAHVDAAQTVPPAPQEEQPVERVQPQRKRTGIPQPTLSPEFVAFRQRYLAALNQRAAIAGLQPGEKLAHEERLQVYSDLCEAEQKAIPSNHAMLLGELAAYHGWPLNKIVLVERSSKYTYAAGLAKDRRYVAIPENIREWLYAK